MVEAFGTVMIFIIIIMQIFILIYGVIAVSRLSGGLRKSGCYIVAGVLLFLFSLIMHLIREYSDISVFHYPEHISMLLAFVLFIIAAKVFASSAKEYLYEGNK